MYSLGVKEVWENNGKLQTYSKGCSKYTRVPVVRGGTRWRSWLGHCATSRKVAGSFTDGVIGNFHWHNPSGCACGPGVDSASNRNEYQVFSGGKGGRCVWQTTLPPSCDGCLEIWELQTPGTLWICPGLYTDICTLPVVRTFEPKARQLFWALHLEVPPRAFGSALVSD